MPQAEDDTYKEKLPTGTGTRQCPDLLRKKKPKNTAQDTTQLQLATKLAFDKIRF